MSNLLIHEPPLQVLPSLAVAIGLNEAIILQQLHYWIERSKNKKDGAYWVYNTIEEWNEQFPFWNEKTIRRAFKSLVDKKLVITGNFNKMPMDRTKWYTIDYMHLDKMSESFGQNDQIKRTKSPDGNGQNDLSNNHRIPEIEKEEGNPVELFEKNFGIMTPHQMTSLWKWVDDFNSKEIICLAINETALINPRIPYPYLEGVLKDWYRRKLFTIEDILREKQKNEDQKRQASPNQQSKQPKLKTMEGIF